MRTLHLFALASIVCGGTLQATQKYVSPEYLAASPDQKLVYVTTATQPSLLVYSVEGNHVTNQWKLKAAPTGLAVASNGMIYVTAGGAEGWLFKLKPNGKLDDRVRVGHTPLSPVISADGKTIYVLNRFDNTVSFVNADRMKVTTTIRVTREPFAAALGAGGKLLFVANHLPCSKATDDVVAAAVNVIDVTTQKAVKNVILPNGSTGVRGCGASPDGKYIYVTHTFGRYQLPTTQLERGWMNTAGLSVFNGETGDYINTALLDDVDLGAANPWGVTTSTDNKWILIAHAGTREVSVIDRDALHLRLDKAAKNEKVTEVTKSATDVPNDLSFLVTIRRRIKVDADGPRGVLALPGRLLAACYFADKLASINLNEPQLKSTLHDLGNPVDLTKDRARRGEMLFNDGSMCFQQWQSCASCHPDARSDALNWDLLNDGIGNPKQSKSMLYAYLTPPTMITGIRPDLQACVRKGMTHIQFVVRPEEDALCVDEYLMSLRPVPSPYLHDGSLSRAARRGKKLFEKAGCIECHPIDGKGPNNDSLYTDMKKHELLGTGNEEKTEFDTPTLVEIWRTAPYLYDGRALTMEEVLTTANPKDIHGATSELKPEEIKDLAEYILSL